MAILVFLSYGDAMGPLDNLPVVAGVDHAVDQVVRRKEFEAAHPEWRIWVDRDSHIWHAERMIEGGQDKIVRYDLRFLLDELERK